MAKRRGPPPDKTKYRCVVKLTLTMTNPDHAHVKKMLDDAKHKGELVIQALLGTIPLQVEEAEEEIADGWGDMIV